jgi:hypothetical protein
MDNSFDSKTIIKMAIDGLTAVGTLVVAILAIWGKWIRAHLSPAKLKIELVDLRGDLTHFTPNNAGAGVVRVYMYHLKVVNERPWISPKNCRVLLKGMTKRQPNGEFIPIPFAVPYQFVWAPAEVTPTIVTIAHEQIFDFGRLPEVQPCFAPAFYSYPNNFSGVVRANEAIRYALQIVSDGYVSQTYQVFEVAWDGQWTSNREEMQTHLAIREI